MTGRERDRDDDQRRQVAHARLDAALARREQAIIERWRAHAERDRGDEQ